jgi:hypothetical protein
MYDMPIIVTEQNPVKLGGTVEPVRKLFTFLEVVEKMEFAATDNPHFWPQVNAIKPHTFVVCGVETHVCVNQTVCKLIEKGMNVHVVADAVNSRNVLDHNVGLRKMELAGAHITTTEMCLFELTEKAGTESFKNIQRMVKGRPLINFRQSTSAAKAAPPPPQTPPPEQTTAPKDTMEEHAGASSKETSPAQGGLEEIQRASPADDVLDMIEIAPPAAEAARVEALLETIEAEKDGPRALTEKTEEEIDKDLRDIDALLGNMDIKDIEGK